MSTKLRYPIPDSVFTRSRSLEAREVKWLLEIIESFPKYRVSPTERYRLDDLSYAVNLHPWFAGNTSWQHPQRLGQFAFITFGFPQTWLPSHSGRPDPDKLDKDEARAFRKELIELLKEVFGQGQYTVGFRFIPHRGPELGRHVHVLLSLIRFPVYLKPWARAFHNGSLSDDTKARWCPFFFDGPHIERASVEGQLVEPYGELLRRCFGDFEDDARKLVHVKKRTTDEPQDQADRDSAAAYPDRIWKRLSQHDVRGFYPGQAGEEVHLHQRQGKKEDFRLSHGDFVRDYLLAPLDRWLRRGMSGFLDGHSHLASVMDFAAKQAHPAAADKCFLDQTPEELALHVARLRLKCPDDPAIPHDGPLLEDSDMRTRPSDKQNFPLDELLSVLGRWPAHHIQFMVPAGGWSSGFLPDLYKTLRGELKVLLQEELGRDGRDIGYVAFPDVCSESGMERLAFGVAVSRVWFDQRDLALVPEFLKLPKDEQQEFLSAFFRHPELRVKPGLLQARWSAALASVGACDPAGADGLVKIRKEHPPLTERMAAADPCFSELAEQQLDGGRLTRPDGRWSCELSNGSAFGDAENSDTLLKSLAKACVAPSLRPFGFFNNRNHDFGRVARLAVDGAAELCRCRDKGQEVLERLCHRLDVNPTTYARRRLTDVLGNSASSRRSGARAPGEE